MTFSIIARCRETGQFGAAISSSSPAVASRCIRARAGIGVAASQNVTDPQLANVLLDLVKYDLTPKQALAELQNSTEFIAYRQLAVLNATDEPAAFSGVHTLGVFHTSVGKDAVCSGNLLAAPSVTDTMLAAFDAATGVLAERLMAAMQAGVAAGGEAGPVHSAGLMVVDKMPWPVVDLRVDWAEQDPIAELYAAWKVYEPQMVSYVQRALNPTLAPSYGVPGDL
ncbi:DUF1028 domain-containing protein [Snodgrassella sp. CFCC 13594]|uniref:DUF1028 domain-containing protein n=1 Tax=Snodgrassella sp. CFCC 13594 TaxID=1775559 RepID=UPI00082FDA8C|nr:DUF1028 domain-containing protein [Snodgrassella sp. CFCC 13594]